MTAAGQAPPRRATDVHLGRIGRSRSPRDAARLCVAENTLALAVGRAAVQRAPRSEGVDHGGERQPSSSTTSRAMTSVSITGRRRVAKIFATTVLPLACRRSVLPEVEHPLRR